MSEGERTNPDVSMSRLNVTSAAACIALFVLQVTNAGHGGLGTRLPTDG